MTRPTFFVSTGRCGTQWFAESLAEHYADYADVDHEPNKSDYEPQLYFNAYHRGEIIDVASRRIGVHLRHVRETLGSRHYIETGWPIYGALPFVRAAFDGKIKVVHLCRHPVRVAASLLTHKWYRADKDDNGLKLFPTDTGVEQSYLAGEAWDSMNQFERCLFWWTELNSFALRFKKQFADVPWLTLRYEDVFSAQGDTELRRLLRFLELPEWDEFFRSRGTRVDRFVARTDQPIDSASVHKYPQALAVMRALEYEDISLTPALSRRYQYTPVGRLVKKTRDFLRVKQVKAYIRQLVAGR